MLAGAGLLAASLSGAQAANFFEKNFWLSGPNYSGNVPACDTPEALRRVQKEFATTESRFWDSKLKIDSIEQVHEVAFRPWGEETIPRRYCRASVVISGLEGTPSFTSDGAYGSGAYDGKVAGKVALKSGHHRTVWYSLIEDGGFLGFSWGVEWCVEGLDRSWTYAPNCRMAQP
ncbi:hypothetical protein [Ancylobacter radicis]|uniref:Uncharacterized protein n=1 Tax=Ancylobacter radicis TaxID=2836179 RepID=A0ABS5RAD9_9HYPH|nr:hypothetical protein [Ancylobacter radicis]MBS9478611.1 hypothetical protein [Ancylobacter radicis]